MQHVAIGYIIPVGRFHAPARHSSRLGQRLQVALGAAAALAAIGLSPGSAQAYVVTVGRRLSGKKSARGAALSTS